MPYFRDIPQFPRAGCQITVPWGEVEKQIEGRDLMLILEPDYQRGHVWKDRQLILEPDYQRGHVWTDYQRVAYVEYGLKGGESSMVITTNCPGLMQDFRGPYEVVDGLQRITAVRMFLNDEIRAFGLKYSEYRDQLTICGPTFSWRVLNLPTRAEVLDLYLLLNSGGVVHTPEELYRVRLMLEKETEK